MKGCLRSGLRIEQIRNGNPVTLTEPKMTRFIMSLEEAVDLVLFAFEHGQNGDILVQKAPACTIQTQAEAVCELFGGKKEDIKVIGIRHGEKMYETLLTNEECAKAEDMGNFYRAHDIRTPVTLIMAPLEDLNREHGFGFHTALPS